MFVTIGYTNIVFGHPLQHMMTGGVLYFPYFIIAKPLTKLPYKVIIHTIRTYLDFSDVRRQDNNPMMPTRAQEDPKPISTHQSIKEL